MEKTSENIFSVTKKAFKKNLKCYVTLKTFRIISSEIKDYLILEHHIYSILKALQPETNSLTYFGLYQGISTTNESFIMEKEDGLITLDDLIKAGKSFKYKEIMHHFKSLVKTLYVLQKNGISHRNISTKKIIVINYFNNISCKFFDFSLSSQLEPGINLISTDNLGEYSDEFSAPELSLFSNKVRGSYNPFLSDVYSLGLVILKMIDSFYSKKDVESGLLNDQNAFNEYPNLENLLKMMLAKDPLKRIDFVGLDEELNKLEIPDFDFEENIKEMIILYDCAQSQQERKRNKTKIGIKSLYEEHWELYIYCEENKFKEWSQYHLEKAWFYLQSLKSKRRSTSIMNDSSLNLSDSCSSSTQEKSFSFYLSEELECLKCLGSLYLKNENYNRSKEFFIGILLLFENKQNETLIEKNNYFLYKFHANGALGYIYQKLGDYSNAQNHYNEYMNILLKNNSKNVENLFLMEPFEKIGDFYFEKGDLLKAKENYKKGLKIKKQNFCQNKEFLISSYENLSKFYQKIGKYKNSLKYCNRSLKLLELSEFSEKNLLEKAKKFKELANIFEKNGDLIIAEENYIKSKIFFEEKGLTNNSHYISCLLDFGNFYLSRNEIKKAEEYLIFSHKLNKKIFGKKNLETAHSYDIIGNLFLQKQDRAKSYEKYMKAFEIRKELFGETSLITNISYMKLGEYYQIYQDFQKSEELFLKAYEISANLSQSPSFMLAESCISMGFLYQHIGNLAKAEEFMLKALLNYQQLYPKEHYELATCLNSLGVLYENFQDYNKAEENYLKSLDMKLKILGDVHPDVLGSYDNLGDLYELKGEFNKAEPYFRKSLKNCKRIFGEQNFNTSQAFNNLGIFYCKIGQLNKAEKYHLKALEIKTGLYGERHEEIANSLSNLGLLYQKLEDYEKAEKNLLEAGKIFLNLFGENNLKVANSYNNLSGLYQITNKLGLAEEFILKAKAIFNNIYGENHQTIADIFLSLANINFEKGETSKAEEYYQNHLKVLENLFGKDSKEIGEGFVKLAGFYEENENGSLAQEFYLKGLECFKKNEYQEECSIILNDLGLLSSKLGFFEKAEEFYQSSLKIREEIYGENHVNTAQIYNNLGLLYKNMDLFDKAELFYMKASIISIKLFGETHKDTATSFNNLAGLFFKKSDFEKAEGCYLKSIKILEEIFGEKNENTALIYNNLGALYGKMNRKEDAIVYGTKAYEVCSFLYGENNRTTKIFLCNLESYK